MIKVRFVTKFVTRTNKRSVYNGFDGFIHGFDSRYLLHGKRAGKPQGTLQSQRFPAFFYVASAGERSMRRNVLIGDFFCD